MQIADERPTIEDLLVAEASLDEVRRAVASLPDKQRTAVVMHKYGGVEYADIARRFGCTESAVKSLMFRAHERLRGMLAETEAA
jgi:RNA polymerase sigma-70 factor (ECF subfamily)